MAPRLAPRSAARMSKSWLAGATWARRSVARCCRAARLCATQITLTPRPVKRAPNQPRAKQQHEDETRDHGGDREWQRDQRAHSFRPGEAEAVRHHAAARPNRV